MSARSIISAKVIELKLVLQKDQIMNFELSSHALKSKLRKVFIEKDNFENEILLNVMESSIMNSGLNSDSLEFNPSEKMGIYLINFVRFLVLKPPIRLSEDQDVLLNIQFAFYQERRRKYLIAANKYEEVENMVHSLSEESAFANLHNGFCLAMLGERQKALVKLDKVQALFPGTHYSENAKLLIGFIKESEVRRESIQSKPQSKYLLANELYTNGNYKDTLKTLESVPVLSKDLSYIQARSWEELGNSNLAIKSYIGLTNQSENKSIAIKANRRLLLIGSFYQDNQELVKLSTQKAISLGDSSSVHLVAEGKSHLKESKISQLIKQSQDYSSSDVLNSFVSIQNDESLEYQELAHIIESSSELASLPKTQSEVTGDARLKIELKDGRIVYPIEITLKQETLVLKMIHFPISTPIGNIKNISVEGNKDPSSNYITVTYKNGNKSRIDSCQWGDGNFIFYSFSSNQEKVFRKFSSKEILKFSIE